MNLFINSSFIITAPIHYVAFTMFELWLFNYVNYVIVYKYLIYKQPAYCKVNTDFKYKNLAQCL